MIGFKVKGEEVEKLNPIFYCVTGDWNDLPELTFSPFFNQLPRKRQVKILKEVIRLSEIVVSNECDFLFEALQKGWRN